MKLILSRKTYYFLVVLAITCLCITAGNSVFAQAPQGVNYQAVARDTGGVPLANTAIDVEINITSDAGASNILWQETHNMNTNRFGLFNLVIGQGTSTGVGSVSNFSDIAWGSGDKYLNVRIDPGSGTFQNMGTSQLLSVPYALYAEKSGSPIDSMKVVGDTLILYQGGDSLTSIINLPPSTDSISNFELVGDTALRIIEGGDTFTADATTLVNNDTNEAISSFELIGDTMQIIEGGDTFKLNISSLLNNDTNELQNLSRSGDTLFISDGDSVILADLDSTNELQALSISNDTVFLSDGGFAVLPQDNDTSATNEIQSISISNDTVFLSNGGFAVLPPSTSNDNDSTNELQNLSLSGDTLFISDGDSVILADLDSTNELQAISISNDTVFLSDGGFAVLPQDNDTSATNEIQTITISNDTVFLSNGGFAVLPQTNSNDNDSTNELQNLSLNGDTLFISDGDSVILADLDSTNELQALSISNDTVFLSDGGFAVLPQDNDTSATNEIQAISISNDTIFLTNGGFAILPPNVVNNDNDSTNEFQDLSLNGDTLFISDGDSVILADLDSTNELQALSISNDTVFLSDGGFAVLPQDNDTSATNEIQAISISNDTIFLTNGGFAILPPNVVNNDNDSTNEFQDLSLNGDTLFISDGDSVILADLDSTNELQALSISNDTVFLSDGGFAVLPQDNDTSATNEIQAISISNDTIFLTNGGFAILPPNVVNNDNDSTNEFQDLSLNGDTLFISDGDSVILADLDSTNELQALSISNDTVFLSDGGFAVLPQDNDTSATNEIQAISISNDTIFLTNGGFAILPPNVVNNDNDSTNEFQDLSLNGDTLFISDGDSVILADLDSTNELQAISISNDTIFLSDGGFAILPPAIVNNDNDSTNEFQDLSRNGDTIFISDGDSVILADLDSTNELQDLSLSGDTLFISDGDSVILADLDSTNELQVLSISNDTIFLSDGGFAVLPPAAINNDNDSTNEFQDLSLSGDTLFISDGDSVLLADLDSTNEQIDSVYFSNDSVIVVENGIEYGTPISGLTNNDTLQNVELVSGNTVLRITDGNGQISDLDISALATDAEVSADSAAVADSLDIVEALLNLHIANDNDTSASNEQIDSVYFSNDSVIVVENGIEYGTPISGLTNNDTLQNVELVSGNTVLRITDGNGQVSDLNISALATDAEVSSDSAAVADSLDIVEALLNLHIANDNDTSASNEQIDSVYFSNDSVIVVENGIEYGTPISGLTNNDTLQNVELVSGNTVLRITDGNGQVSDLNISALATDAEVSSDSAAVADSLDIVEALLNLHIANDNDTSASNEQIDSVYFSNDSVIVVENGIEYGTPISGLTNNDTLQNVELVSGNTVLRITDGNGQVSDLNISTLATDAEVSSDSAAVADSLDIVEALLNLHIANDNDTSASNEQIDSVYFSNDSVIVVENGIEYGTPISGLTNNDTLQNVELVSGNTVLRITDGNGQISDLNISALATDAEVSSDSAAVADSLDIVEALLNLHIANDNDTSASNEQIDSVYFSNDSVIVVENGIEYGTPISGLTNNDTLQNVELVSGNTVLRITDGNGQISDLNISALATDAEVSSDSAAVADSLDIVEALLNLHIANDNDTSASNEQIDSVYFSNDSVIVVENGIEYGTPISGLTNNDTLQNVELVSGNTVLRITDGNGQVSDLNISALATDAEVSSDSAAVADSLDIVEALLNLHIANDNDTSASNEQIDSVYFSNDSVIVVENGIEYGTPISGLTNNDTLQNVELVSGNTVLRITDGNGQVSDLNISALATDAEVSADSAAVADSLDIVEALLNLHIANDNDTSASNEQIDSVYFSNDSVIVVENGIEYGTPISGLTNNDTLQNVELVSGNTVLRITDGNGQVSDLNISALATDAEVSSDSAAVADSLDIVEALLNLHIANDNDTSASNEQIDSVYFSNDSVIVVENGIEYGTPISGLTNNDTLQNVELVSGNTVLRITDGNGQVSDLNISALATDAEVSADSAAVADSLDIVEALLNLHIANDNDTSASNEQIDSVYFSNDSVIVVENGIEYGTPISGLTNNDTLQNVELVSGNTVLRITDGNGQISDLNISALATDAEVSADSAAVADSLDIIEAELDAHIAADNDTSATNEIISSVTFNNSNRILTVVENGTSYSDTIPETIFNDTIVSGSIVGTDVVLVDNTGDQIVIDINSLATDAELSADSAAIADSLDIIEAELDAHIAADNDTSASNEIISSVTFNNSNRILTVVENGVSYSDTIPETIFNDTIVSGSIVGTDIVLVDNTGDQITIDINSLATDAEVSADSIAVADSLDIIEAELDAHIAADNDTSATNELQNLSNTVLGNQRTINITGGTSTTFSIADADSSTTNELQNLSINGGGDSLLISDGNGVTLASLQVSDTLPIIKLGDTNKVEVLSNKVDVALGNTTRYSLLDDEFFFNQDGASNFLFTTNHNGSWNLAFTSISGVLVDGFTGTHNFFWGRDAGRDILTGSDNIGLGSATLRENEAGSGNIGLGSGSLLSHLSGDDNVAIGRNAGASVTGGSNSIFIGEDAGSNSSQQTGVIKIGAAAGSSDTTDNKLYIENSSSASPLIYGDFSSNILQVGGTFKTNNLGGDTLTYPIADGNAGEFLRTDGNGNLTFASALVSDSTTASNGLTLIGKDVTLGGALTGNTTITGSGFDLTLNLLAAGSNFLINDGTNTFFDVNNSGRIGIGTAPSTSLININSTNEDDVLVLNSSKVGTTVTGISSTVSGSGSGTRQAGNFTASGGSAQNIGVAATTTGTGLENFAVKSQATGTGTNNYGIYTDATGGTKNFGAFFNTGAVYVNDSLGIGTTAPTEKLEVVGGIKADSIQITGGSPSEGYFLRGDAFGNAYWDTIAATPNDADWDTTSTAVYNTTKNIGIGTSTPSLKLEVVSTDTVAAGVTNLSNITDFSAGLSVGNQAIGTGDKAAGVFITDSPVAGGSHYGIIATAAGADTNNVGIQASSTDDNGTNNFGVFALADSGDNNYGVYGAAAGSDTNYAIFGDAAGGTVNYAGYFSSGRVVIGDSLGIGTETPSEKLEVVGGIKADSIQITGGSPSEGYFLRGDAAGNAYWDTLTAAPNDGDWDTTSTAVYNTAKNIGIGTSTPDYKLSVLNTSDTISALFENGAASGSPTTAINAVNSGGGTGNKYGGVFTATGAGGGAGSENHGIISSANNGADANVGITGLVESGGASVNIGVSGRSSAAGIADTAAGIFAGAEGPGVNIGLFSQASGGSANFAAIFDTGNVYIGDKLGVGVLSPISPLEVKSDATTPVLLRQSHTGVFASAIRSFNDSIQANSDVAYVIGKEASTNNAAWVGYRHKADGSDSNSMVFSLWDEKYIMNITAQRRVGINTQTPEVDLHVDGRIKADSIQLIDGASNGYYLRSDAMGNAFWDTLSATGTQGLDSVLAAGNDGAGQSIFNVDTISMGTATPLAQLHIETGTADGMRMNTTSATKQYFRYTQNGLTRIGGLISSGNSVIQMSDASNNTDINLSTNGDSWFNGGEVGIGTNAPTSTLHIQKSDGTANLMVEETNGTTSPRNLITLENNGPARISMEDQNIGVNWLIRSDSSLRFNKNGSGAWEFILDTLGTGTFRGELEVDGTGNSHIMGNLGIGTSSPDSLLDVAGGASIDRLNINSAFTLPTANGTAGQVMVANPSGLVTWESVGTDTLAELKDGDGDTKIQLDEGGADDDIIRFDMAGTEYLTLDGGRINVLNTGNSVFLGDSAGFNDDGTDNKNVHIGQSAGMSGSGSTPNNVFIGNHSGRLMTSGFSNTFVGMNSGRTITSGTDNAFFGAGAGGQTTSGNNNTFIGTGAGNNNSGNANTFLGRQAGNAVSTGDSNVFIGYRAGFNETGSRKLFINNNSSSTPLIYGDFANDSLKVYGLLAVDSAKNGSGYTFPGQDGSAGQVMTTDGAGVLSWGPPAGDNLGNHTMTTNLQTGGNFISNDGDNEGIFVATDGNVGIGTNSPLALIHTEDTASDPTYYHARLMAPNMANGEDFALAFGKSTSFKNQAEMRYAHQSNNNDSNRIQFGFNSVQPFVSFTANERVGIGTEFPTSNVEIFNNTASNNMLSITNENTASSSIINFKRARTGQSNAVNGDFLGILRFSGYHGTGYEIGARIRAQVDGVPGTGDMPTRLLFETSADGTATPAERMRITNGGLVGIGTTTPDSTLTVAGGIKTTDFTMTNGASNGFVLTSDANGVASWATAPGDGNGIYDGSGSLSGTTNVAMGADSLSFSGSSVNAFSVDDSTLSVDAANNRVGIGIANPESDLHIFTDEVGGNRLTLEVAKTSGATGIDFKKSHDGKTIVSDGDNLGLIDFYGHDGTSYVQTARIRSKVDGTPGVGDMPSRLYFQTTLDGTATPVTRLMIKNDGNVGIGNTSPDSLLDVGGGATIDRLNINSAFTFPSANGSSGQVLTANPSGLVSWENGTSNDEDSTRIAFGNTSVMVDNSDNINFSTDGEKRLIIRDDGQFDLHIDTAGIFYVQKQVDAFGVHDSIVEMVNLDFRTNDFANRTGAYISFSGTDNNSGNVEMGRLEWSSTSSEDDGFLAFWTTNAVNGPQEAMTISDEQYVGIGNRTPAEELDVTGTATIDTLNVNSNYTFPSDAGSVGQVLVNDGAGQLNWVDRDTSACPAGFISVNSQYCISTTARSAATWFAAANDCGDEGAKLPSYSEWYVGVQVTGITDEGMQWEWVDDLTQNNVMKVGDSSITDRAAESPTNSEQYRCVFYK